VEYCRAAFRHRLAACGIAFVRGACGVRGDERDRARIDDELFGGDLYQRGLDALTELGFAGEDGDFPIGVDSYPRIEVRCSLETAGKPGRRFRLHADLLSFGRRAEHVRRKREAHDQRAAAREEVAPGE
jgi:hypothetical protein